MKNVSRLLEHLSHQSTRTFELLPYETCFHTVISIFNSNQTIRFCIGRQDTLHPSFHSRQTEARAHGLCHLQQRRPRRNGKPLLIPNSIQCCSLHSSAWDVLAVAMLVDSVALCLSAFTLCLLRLARLNRYKGNMHLTITWSINPDQCDLLLFGQYETTSKQRH